MSIAAFNGNPSQSYTGRHLPHGISVTCHPTQVKRLNPMQPHRLVLICIYLPRMDGGLNWPGCYGPRWFTRTSIVTTW